MLITFLTSGLISAVITMHGMTRGWSIRKILLIAVPIATPIGWGTGQLARMDDDAHRCHCEKH